MKSQNSKTKLVFIGYFNDYGGAQKQTIIIANAMSRLGYRVTIVSLGKYKQRFAINNNVNIINIADDIKGNFIILNRYRQLKKILKHEKPDITISFWLQPIYLAAIIGKKNTGKLIYSERCDPSDKQYKGILGIIRNISFKKVDGFVFQTNAAKNYFNKSIRKKSVIIPNPIIVDNKLVDRTKPNNMEHTIVSVGRLHKQKNFELLIKAFDLIKNDIKDYNLTIYGEGEERSRLESIIKDKKIEDRVSMPGSTNNTLKSINGAALFVLSSDYEGMPNALLEAMSIGIPCISTNWSPGGVTDIINNNYNGIIIPKNDEQELAKAIKKIIENKKLAKEISNNSKNMDKYNPERIYKKWDDFIKQNERTRRQ